MDKDCKLSIHSPLPRAVHIDGEVTARTAKSSVAFFADFAEMSGSIMESDLILSLKSARLRYCQPSNMHVRPA